jgi:hypothetical protein
MDVEGLSDSVSAPTRPKRVIEPATLTPFRCRGLIAPTEALREPRWLGILYGPGRCRGILYGPVLWLGILLGPGLCSFILRALHLCSGISHALGSGILHGPNPSLLLHVPDRWPGIFHDRRLGILYRLYARNLRPCIFLLYRLYGLDLWPCIFLGRPGLELI